MAGTLTATKYAAAGMVRLNVDFTAANNALTATVTAYLADGTSYVVRGAGPVTLSAEVAIVDDYEVPLDTVTYWTAVANTGDTASTAPLTLGSSEAFGQPTAWLKDPAIPARNVPVQFAGSGMVLTRSARQGVFDVIGRANPAAVAAVRASARTRVLLASVNPATIPDMRQVISSGQTLLLQAPSGYQLPPNWYVAVGDVDEVYPTKTLRHSARYWQLDVTTVDRPTTAAQAQFNTWADATATYGTWGAMAAVTWLTVMQGSDPDAGGSNTYADPVYGGAIL